MVGAIKNNLSRLYLKARKFADVSDNIGAIR